MLSKAIKLYINSPIDCEWKEAYEIHDDISYQCSKILNACMSELFLHEKKRVEMYDELERWPKKEELPVPYLYPSMREKFSNIASSTVAALTRIAGQRWSSDKKEVFYSMQKSLSSYKKTYGIPMHNKQYKLWHNDDGYFIRFSVQSGRNNARTFKLSQKILGGQKEILDRIISGEYKQGQCTWKKKNKKLFFVITYSFEPKPIALDKNIICGIDLGLAIPVYCAISNSKQRWSSNDGFELEKFRRNINRRRRQIQKQYPVSGRSGHGRKRALKPLEKLQDKVNNYRNNKYHVYTKRIIEFCLKNNAGTIQLENLKSLKKNFDNNITIRDWAIGDFHQKLEYKAKEVGIDVVYIDPKYTSQRCSKCGHISKDNRKKQSEFICIECGYKENADYNAAKNISIKDIDKIIDKELTEDR